MWKTAAFDVLVCDLVVEELCLRVSEEVVFERVSDEEVCERVVDFALDDEEVLL